LALIGGLSAPLASVFLRSTDANAAENPDKGTSLVRRAARVYG